MKYTAFPSSFRRAMALAAPGRRVQNAQTTPSQSKRIYVDISVVKPKLSVAHDEKRLLLNEIFGRKKGVNQQNQKGNGNESDALRQETDRERERERDRERETHASSTQTPNDANGNGPSCVVVSPSC